MKTVRFSVDCAEWTRYYYEIDVEDNLSPDEIKEAAYEAVSNCTARDLGAKCLGNIEFAEFADNEYNWPDDGSFAHTLPPMSYDSERLQAALLRGPVPARRHVVVVLLVYATAIAAYVML